MVSQGFPPDTIDILNNLEQRIHALEIAMPRIDGSQVVEQTITGSHIMASSVYATHIAASQINTLHLNAQAVTADKIAAGSITASHITASSITASMIRSDTILANHIAASQIQTRHLTASSITASHLSANSINASSIQASAIRSHHILASQIEAHHIVASAIQAQHIDANSIRAGHITASSIQTQHLTASSILAQHITASQVQAYHIAVNDLAALSANMGNITAGNLFLTAANSKISTSLTGAGARLDINREGIHAISAAGTRLFYINALTGEVQATGININASGTQVEASVIAGQLTSAQIAQVSAAQIIGQLSADQFNVIFGGGNQLRNSGFTRGSTGWSVVGGAGVFGSYGRTTSGVQLTRNTGTTGMMTVITNSASANLIRVFPGEKYALSAYTKADSNGRSARVRINWYKTQDSTNPSTVSASLQGSNVSSNTSSWIRPVAVGIAPSDTNWARVSIEIQSVPNGEIHYVDEMQFENGEIVTSYAPRPNEIDPGSIGAEEIAHLSIGSAHITNGAVVPSHIQGIAASQINIGQLSSAQIASIDATQVAGQLTASQIAALNSNQIIGQFVASQIAGVHAAVVSGQLTSAQIASVSAAAIAGQLTASQIATINATQIIGQVVASQLNVVFGGANLLSDSSFEFSIGDWVSSTNVSSLTRSTVQKRFGDHCLRNVIEGLAQSNSRVWYGKRIAVSPNEKLTLSTYVYNNVVNRKFRVRIDQFDASSGGSLLSSTNSTYTDAGPVGWLRSIPLTVTLDPAAQAVNIYVEYATISGANLPASEVWYVDGAQLEYGEYATAYAPKPEEILPGTVGSAQLAVGSVTTEKMVANTILGDRIQTNSLNADRIVASSITAAQIAAATITGDRIAGRTIAASQIVASSITTSEIGAGAVNANRITASTITVDQIAASTITSSKLVASTIQATNIAAGAITAGHIVASAINSHHITANAILAEHITASTITGTHIAASTVAARNLVASTITAGQIAASTITTELMAAGAITANKIAVGTITANEIAAGAITANKLNIVAGGGNFLINSGFENTEVPFDGWNAASRADRELDTTVFKKGFGRVAAKLTVNSTAGSVSMSSYNASEYRFEVLGNKWYTGSFWCAPAGLYNDLAANPVQYRAGLVWYDSGGNLVGSTSFGALVTRAAGWQRVYATGQAPATATEARLVCYVSWTATSIGQIYRIDDAQVEEGDIPSSYAPKTDEILPGTIVANMIAASQIVGDHIAAQTIYGDKLRANTVSAQQIAANAITASHISAGSILTSHITASTLNGDRITASTIAATKLIARSITAGEIAVGTITGNEILANSITAAELKVGGGGVNMLANSGFEDTSVPTTGNVSIPGWSTKSNSRTGRVTSVKKSGGSSMSLIADITASGSYVSSVPVSVIAGQRYSASVYVLQGTGSRNCELSIEWLNDASSSVAKVAGETVNALVTPGGTWTRAVVENITAPPGATQARMTLVMTSAGSVNDFFLVDEAMFEMGGVASPWSKNPRELVAGEITGTYIAEGAITTNHMTANTINANVIMSRTILGSQLVASTITAGEIAARSILATNIVASSLTSAELQAGSITADKINFRMGGRNIVPDSSFEQGLGDWTTVGTSNALNNGGTATRVTSATTTPFLGSYSTQVVTTGTANLQGIRSGILNHKFLSGIPYMASVWVKRTAGSVGMSMSFGSHVTGSVDRATATFTPTSTWTRYSVGWTPTADTSSAQLAVRTATAGVVTFYIDAVQIEMGEVATDWSQYIDPTVIDGSSITGALIRTAVSGPRLEMDGTNGLRVYDNVGVQTAQMKGGGGGLDLTIGSVATPEEERKVRWLFGPVSLADLGAGFQSSTTWFSINAKSPSASGAANLSLNAQSHNNGAHHAALQVTTNDPEIGASGIAQIAVYTQGSTTGVENTRVITDSNNRSSFMQIASTQDAQKKRSYLTRVTLYWTGASTTSSGVLVTHNFGVGANPILTVADEFGVGPCFAYVQGSTVNSFIVKAFAANGTPPAAATATTVNVLVVEA